MNINEILQIEKVDKLSQDNVNQMQALLDEGKRAEVYIYYQQLTGESDDQLMMQAQITTYSGATGGAALEGNYNAKISNPDTYNLGLDEFSVDIIQGVIDAIDINLNNPDGTGTGILTTDEIQRADQNVWTEKGLGDYFPGLYQVEELLFSDFLKNLMGEDTAEPIDNAALSGFGGKELGKYSGEFSDAEHVVEWQNRPLDAIYPIRNWRLAMNRFMIEFEEQLATHI